ncbi:MAG: hypothetical protein FWC28_01190, partial [Proteobacteria bacterium]|nr:hypothetical protein [Pseudomonadota bacterium]
MKAWKLWSLSVLLATGVACNVGGIKIDGRKCVVGLTDCGAGNTCVPTELGATEGTCRELRLLTCTSNADCSGGQVCYRGACTNLASIACAEGGTWCPAGYVCDTSLLRCEFGTTPGECRGMANGVACANGSGVCYQELCTNPADVPCEEGGAWCPAREVCVNGNCEDERAVPCADGGTLCIVPGEVCNPALRECERGTVPGECENLADGELCDNGNGVCYQRLCRDPGTVPCADGGTQCSAGEVCNPNLRECERGTVPGECENLADGTLCDNNNGICYQNLCRDPDDVPCALGGTQQCPAGEVCNPTIPGCEIGPIGQCENEADGTLCDNNNGICYQRLCRDPGDVPCGVGGG